MSGRYTWERVQTLSHFKREYEKNKEYVNDNISTIENIKLWLSNNERILKKQDQIQLCLISIFANIDEVDSCLNTIFTPCTRKGRNLYELWCERYGKRYSEIYYLKMHNSLSKAQIARNLNPETASVFKLRKQWYIDRNNLERYYEVQRITKESLPRGEDWKNIPRDHRSVEYWKIKHGLDQESAEIEVKKYIERHRKESVIGVQKSFKKKYGKDWKIEYDNFKKSQGKYFSKRPCTRTSKQSMNAFSIIECNLKDIISSIHYEYYISIPGNTIKFYDAKITFICGKQALVEYDGTSWHVVYGYENHYIGYKFGISVEEQIEKDKLKESIAKLKGFDIIRIHSEMSEIEYCEKIRQWYDGIRL